MRRIVSPWEYRHLQAWARVRIAAGIGLVGLGAVTLSFGGNDGTTYGWTAFWLVLAASRLIGMARPGSSWWRGGRQALMCALMIGLS